MGTIVINVERCKGCELCVHACSRKAIGISARINSKGYHPAELADSERCNGCGICAMMCPDVAIVEVWR